MTILLNDVSNILVKEPVRRICVFKNETWRSGECGRRRKNQSNSLTERFKHCIIGIGLHRIEGRVEHILHSHRYMDCFGLRSERYSKIHSIYPIAINREKKRVMYINNRSSIGLEF